MLPIYISYGGTTSLGAGGAGRECFTSPFLSWYNVTKPILMAIVGCLLFAQGSHPVGRLLHVNVVVYLTYLHCSCPMFQNCCSTRKVHGGQRRKTVIHCTAILFNNALLQQTLAGRAKRRNFSSPQTCTSDVFVSNKPVKESGTSYAFILGQLRSVTPAIVDTEADNGQYHYRYPYTDIVLVDVI